MFGYALKCPKGLFLHTNLTYTTFISTNSLGVVLHNMILVRHVLIRRMESEFYKQV